MDSLKDLLINKDEYIKNAKEKGKYVTKEYQDYGIRLAKKLGADKKQYSMFIKFAKVKPRGLLEKAYSFTDDYPGAKDKVRIFMWKLKQVEDEYKAKKEAEEKQAAEEQGTLF